MIADAKARRFVRIYVWKFDRFARNVHDAVVYKTLLQSVGVELVSVKEPLTDPQSPASECWKACMDGVAEWYSADLKQKMRRAKQARAESGLYNGDLAVRLRESVRPSPLHPEGVHQQPSSALHPKRHAVVLTLFDRYATGNQSMREIADFVNTLGFKTRNKRKKSEHGVVGPRPFTKDSIRDMLTNPFYLGKMRYKGEVREGKHEAIVSDELWEKCRAIRENHAKRPRTWNKAFRTYLLKGLRSAPTVDRTCGPPRLRVARTIDAPRRREASSAQPAAAAFGLRSSSSRWTTSSAASSCPRRGRSASS